MKIDKTLDTYVVVTLYYDTRPVVKLTVRSRLTLLTTDTVIVCYSTHFTSTTSMCKFLTIDQLFP